MIITVFLKWNIWNLNEKIVCGVYVILLWVQSIFNINV